MNARNAFQDTLLGLEFTDRYAVDIFSTATVEAFHSADDTAFGYAFTQLFESDVLREIALLQHIEYGDLAELRHCPTPSMMRLGERVDNAANATALETITTCSMLVSVSRFDLAARLLTPVRERERDGRTRFEIGWLDFLISNRRADGADSPAAFAAMRSAVDTGAVPDNRILDVCAQGVVWYLKRKEIPAEDFDWCLRSGERVVSTGTGDAAAISSWYRGVAMYPAANGDPALTRDYMRRARDAAEQAVGERPRALERNLVKTYYESSMKEHMYVHRDADAAVAAGRALIELDPAWAPSYAELAEAYELFGAREDAAVQYEHAVAAGPPYLGHHLARAARARLALDDPQRALEHYCSLLSIAPDSRPVREAARPVAERVDGAVRARFEDLLAGADR